MNEKVEIPIPQEILFQILKELPAKSLLRFRCVSKLWCFIIDDPFFIDSHRTRSHTRPGGTSILVQSESPDVPDGYDFLSLKPEGGSRPVFLQTLTSPNGYLSSQSVNGLVCFANVVWNPTTRESIQLPPLDVPGDLDIHVDLYGGYNTTVRFRTDCFLGFAPSTMEYKVLNICRVTKSIPDSPARLWETQIMCKILTIGTNLWRNTDVLPGEFERFCVKSSIYVNGMIYWSLGDKAMMLAFDVGLEKFRWISLPRAEDRLSCPIQVGERLAVIDVKFKKIWILDDTGCWSMERLVIPYSTVKSNIQNHTSLTPVGTIHTKEILLLSPNRLKLFYCNPYSKTFRRIPYPGLPKTYSTYDTLFTKQVECLFRLKRCN